ncbi:MAG: EF-hand domain-containing protein [Pirellulaceae bacterium]
MNKRRLMVPYVLLLTMLLASSTALGQGGFGEADADEDGKVSASEMETYVSGKLTDFDKHKELMEALDTDKDGSLSAEEFENRMEAVQGLMGGVAAGDDSGSRRGRRGNRRPEEGALKVGDVAPTFTLKSLDGDSETDLAEFRDQKPVVLIFGSYT